MIFEIVEGFGAVFVDRVITLAVAVRIEQIIQLQGAVIGHKGHHVAHVTALGRGIQAVFHCRIRLVRDGFGIAALRILLRRSQRQIPFGVRRGALRTAAAGRQEQGKNQEDGKPILLHCEHTFLIF